MKRRTVLIAWALALPLAAAEARDPMSVGDAAWARRAQGASAGWAAAEPIAEAVAAYQEAVRQDPERLEGYWKLLRAIYFQGDMATRGEEAKKEVFALGRDVGEKALDLLATRVGGRKKMDAMSPDQVAAALGDVPEAAAIFFWSAVDWGLWGDAFGRMAAARQGVAGRVRDYSLVVVALDEGYERAGAHRVLGRLHFLAPRIPFVTGWVSRDTAVSELERACELGPEEPLNGLYLAEALVEHRPRERDRALGILRDLVARAPDPERAVEWARAQSEARALLARLEAR